MSENMITLERLEPRIADSLEELWEHIWRGAMPPSVLESCRLRMAEMLGYETAPIGETLLIDPQYLVSEKSTEGEMHTEGFKEGERSALSFTEKFVIDPHGITDEDCEALSRHFTPEQLANLTIALATFEGIFRSQAALEGVIAR